MPAYYRASLTEFLTDDPKKVLGELTAGSSRDGFYQLKHRQTKAWQKELNVLREAAKALTASDAAKGKWCLLLEYPIPRRQKRIDAVILGGGIIFCLEFKSEEDTASRQTQRQVEDYALDLRDFHAESRGVPIIPIAVTRTGSKPTDSSAPIVSGEVRSTISTAEADLAAQLSEAFDAEASALASQIDGAAWDTSAYRPVPTIIEAAEALYAGHDVREIAHSHAGTTNLTLTSDRLIALIEQAQRESLKLACFVTGIPGAGKTLAGLNVVHAPVLRQNGRPAPVFLSGNYPLVKIVSAAIVRDARRRKKETGVERAGGTLVQNVNVFFREAQAKPGHPPAENVVIFDEAQRAWDATQNEKKSGQEISQPESMLAIMDRHKDWAVVVALVGGGQEIHDGEAGLAEWGRALREKFTHWRVAAPPEALDGDVSLSAQRLFESGNLSSIVVRPEPTLHLNVCIRSFRAKRVAEWVESVLCGDAANAIAVAKALQDFPLALTRSLDTARSWLRAHTRGLRRSGLVASSSATRLRAHGIELSSGFRQENRDMYAHWYLAPPSDIRASNQLEVAASEFECQGLELDWVGVCWGGDLTFGSVTTPWQFQNLSGSKWSTVKSERDRRYLLNTYRVLLTRAREGMIIWVPTGDDLDATRPRGPFDATAEHLKRCGLAEI